MEIPKDWKMANSTLIFKRDKKKGSGELQPRQPNLSPQKGYGAKPTWSHFQPCEEQGGGWEHPAQIYQG